MARVAVVGSVRATAVLRVVSGVAFFCSLRASFRGHASSCLNCTAGRRKPWRSGRRCGRRFVHRDVCGGRRQPARTLDVVVLAVVVGGGTTGGNMTMSVSGKLAEHVHWRSLANRSDMHADRRSRGGYLPDRFGRLICHTTGIDIVHDLAACPWCFVQCLFRRKCKRHRGRGRGRLRCRPRCRRKRGRGRWRSRRRPRCRFF
mmetsp:Transcript_35362/g.114508  ORF Transcript_35362/g.114508 Transcript_35362/m.114508 type:complete len:202 (-) Transcript_35362:1191-1796(-)